MACPLACADAGYKTYPIERAQPSLAQPSRAGLGRSARVCRESESWCTCSWTEAKQGSTANCSHCRHFDLGIRDGHGDQGRGVVASILDIPIVRSCLGSDLGPV